MSNPTEGRSASEVTFESRGATAFSSSSEESTGSQEESLAALMKEDENDKEASRDKVWRRQDYETRSIGKVSVVDEDDKISQTVVADKEEEESLPEIRPVKSFRSRLSNAAAGKKAGKSILKNKNTSFQKLGQSQSSFKLEIANSEPKDYDSKPMMQTNLKLKTWSVSSFDSCGGDTRRNYQNFLSSAQRLTTARTFSVFRTKNDEVLEIPSHTPSEYEDPQPFGPSDTSSPFFTGNKRTKRLSLANGLSKLRSFASFGTGKRSKSSHASSNRSRRSLAGRMFDKFFGSKRSQRDLESDIMKLPLNLDFDTKDEFKEAQQKDEEARLAKLKDKERFKQALQSSNEQDSAKKTLKGKNEMPDYIPPDMVWDPKFDFGKGGLVNKEPTIIPKNKIWSKEANQGKGGLINKPVNPATIPGTQIWSRSAFNGQGGIVNKRPQKIPRGKVWDEEAEDGLGGLVDATEEQMKKLKERKEERRQKRKMKGKEKVEKLQRQSKERKEKNGKVKFAVAAKEPTKEEMKRELIRQTWNDEVAKITGATDSPEEKEELLAALKAETEAIMANLDKKDAELEEVKGDDNTLERKAIVEAMNKLEELEKTTEEKENKIDVKTVEVEGKSEEIDQKALELETKEFEMLTKLEEAELEIMKVEVKIEDKKEDLPVIQEEEKEIEIEEPPPRRRRKSSMMSLSLRRGMSSMRNLMSTKKKQGTLPSQTSSGKRRIKKSFMNGTRSNSGILNPFGIQSGTVHRLFSKYERMSQGGFDDDEEHSKKENDL